MKKVAKKKKTSNVVVAQFGLIQAIEAFPRRWLDAAVLVAATQVSKISRPWSRDEWATWLDGVDGALASLVDKHGQRLS